MDVGDELRPFLSDQVSAIGAASVTSLEPGTLSARFAGATFCADR
jgi:hypothetical protein